MNSYLIKLARNDDEKRLISQLYNITQKAVDGICGQSDFLDIRQQELARAVAVNELAMEWHLSGGFEAAERQRLVVYPQWETEADDRIAYLKISSKEFKELSLSHRDYLGAILSLGLKREKLGDIVVEKNIAGLIADVKIADFICQQLTRVKNATVSVEMINAAEFVFQSPEPQTLQISLASLRLDVTIAAAFNLSRTDTDAYIKSGKSQINHMEIYKHSTAVKLGDLISVRGLGRFQLKEIGGTSRKGRYYVKIARW